jgi:hypothetical protein
MEEAMMVFDNGFHLEFTCGARRQATEGEIKQHFEESRAVERLAKFLRELMGKRKAMGEKLVFEGTDLTIPETVVNVRVRDWEPTALGLMYQGKLLDKQPIKVAISFIDQRMRVVITALFALTKPFTVDGISLFNNSGDIVAGRLLKKERQILPSPHMMEIVWVLHDESNIPKIFDEENE